MSGLDQRMRRMDNRSVRRRLFMSKRAALMLGSAVLAGCGDDLETQAVATTQAAAAPADDFRKGRPTPSGLPVPRWISLKFGEVNARGGPGDDHRLLWTYRVKNLPVQVIAETRDWRRVCDGEGSVSWIHKRVTTGERYALNLASAPAPLFAKPQAGAGQKALLAPGALAKVSKCEAGWCRIEAGSARGWSPAGQLWGTAEQALCRTKPPQVVPAAG
jgi:SH3-like domain-containing protein